MMPSRHHALCRTLARPSSLKRTGVLALDSSESGSCDFDGSCSETCRVPCEVPDWKSLTAEALLCLLVLELASSVVS